MVMMDCDMVSDSTMIIIRSLIIHVYHKLTSDYISECRKQDYFCHSKELISYSVSLHTLFRCMHDKEDKDDSHDKSLDIYDHKEEESHILRYNLDNSLDDNNGPEFWDDDNERASDRGVDKEDKVTDETPYREFPW